MNKKFFSENSIENRALYSTKNSCIEFSVFKNVKLQ